MEWLSLSQNRSFTFGLCSIYCFLKNRLHFCHLLRALCLIQDREDFLWWFLLRVLSFTLGILYLRSILIFGYGLRFRMGGTFFAYVSSTIPEPLLKPLSLLQRIAFVLLSKIHCLHLPESVSGLSMLFHWSMWLSFCQYYLVVIGFLQICPSFSKLFSIF